MQQRADISRFFSELFDEFLPVQIVELGTGDGEFIDIICKLMQERTDFFSINTFDNGRLRSTSNASVAYHTMNIFENESAIADIIIYPHTLLLCDNGNKKREIEMFAKYLVPGSVLMAHDYAHDYQSFNDHKHEYWRTCELVYADIKDYVMVYEPFQQDLMIKAGWLSLKHV